jgi:1A family penicillin-binding protein
MRGLSLKLVLYVTLALGLVAAGILSLWLSTLTIPDLESFDARKVAQSTKIYDRTGEVLLYDVHENIQRTVIPIEEMSRNIKNATVAIEDTEFYEHIGIRPLAFLRALIVNIRERELSQGGSTITQQVVKNTILTSEKLVSRKLKEWVLALKLEKKLTKDEILEVYLNEAPYGGNLYGIEEASLAYFGKSAADLSIAESAYLAALPQAPTYYSPYGNNRDRLEARKNLVLERMLESEFITEAEYSSAKAEEVQFANRPEIGIKAPHFVFYILEQLEEAYGKRAIEEMGLRVITTLDWELQQKAEAIVLEYALRNESRFNAENAGLVAVDPKTGEILVMVGSRDYFDQNIDGNFNVALANRQPGSAFKPFVYASAFTEGYTPETVVFDVQTQFSVVCTQDDTTSENGCYSPGNYDNEFRGPVTFREALAQSINIPAVKVLYLTGLTDALRLSRAAGIETLTDPGRYGLTLVLGGGEVTLLDITSAYGVFANDGVRNPHVSILKIESAGGTVLEEYEFTGGTRAIDTNVARTISDILADNVARTPLYGPNSLLHFGERDVAVKTGTTNEYRDAWTVGYTPNIAVGAWAGNNDNSSMAKQISGLIITPLWRAFMDEALARIPEESFIPPLPDDPSTLKPVLRGAWNITDPNTQNTEVRSILHWVEKENPRGAVPQNPDEDQQYSYWEYGVERWLSGNTLPEGGEAVQHVAESVTLPRINFSSPTDNERFSTDDQVVITFTLENAHVIDHVVLFIDDRVIGTSETVPFTFSLIPSERGIASGTYRVRAAAVGDYGEATSEIDITIE